MNLNNVAHLFWRGHHDGGETSPASPAKGVACSAKELMRRDDRFAGRLLRVRGRSRNGAWARCLYVVGEGSPAASGKDASLGVI
jgi:hypothetical protein